MYSWNTGVLTPECLFVMNTCQCASVCACQLFLLPLIQEMALQQLLVSCESDEVTKSLAHDHSCHWQCKCYCVVFYWCWQTDGSTAKQTWIKLADRMSVKGNT